MNRWLLYILALSLMAGCGKDTPSGGSEGSVIVEIGSFNADSVSSIQLEWMTTREIRNEGFNVHRSLDVDSGGYIRRNTEIIPGQNRPTTYRFADDSITLGTVHWYKLQWLDIAEDTVWYGPVSATPLSGSIPDFWLGGSTPNPYYIEVGGQIAIRYVVPEQSYITLMVYDTTGNQIRTLIDQVQLPGYYLALWDTKDDNGAQVPEGLYDYALTGFRFGQPIEITKHLEIVEAVGQ